jgi:hypothetical protein
MIVEIHTVKQVGIINYSVACSSVFYDTGGTFDGENLVQHMADCLLTLLCDTVVTIMGLNDGV